MSTISRGVPATYKITTARRTFHINPARAARLTSILDQYGKDYTTTPQF